MDDEIGQQWFQQVFLNNCETARPQLLILDSHHSHEVVDILEMAEEQGIHLMALPLLPHTTHALQPLD
ncbi:DDE-domain-containing protein, partial [Elysia marginata]